MLWKCQYDAVKALNMAANLENSAVAIVLEKVGFHSNPKEKQCQRIFNYCTITLISHTSKVMLKIIQSRLQWYRKQEIPDVQAAFKKGRGTRDQIANIRWIIEKAKTISEKRLFMLHWLCQSLLFCGAQQTGKLFKRWQYKRNLWADREATIRIRRGTMDWFQIG